MKLKREWLKIAVRAVLNFQVINYNPPLPIDCNLVWC